MTADDTTATPPADEEGGKPGTGRQVSPADGGAVSGRRGGTGTALDLGWGKILVLMAWGFVVLAFAAGGLADVTRLWWLVLVFGAAVPFLLALQNRRSRVGGELPPDHEGERELLDVLRERGEVSARRGKPPVEPDTALRSPTPQPLAEPLSGRELEVLGLMALGRTNAEISRELFVAVGTVKAHANNIYRKLDANNRSEAVSKAGRLGLLR